jgi:hypothetical protein
MTHACCLDVSIDVGEELFILFGIFASNENVERNLSAFQRFQMLGWTMSVSWQPVHDLGIMSYLSLQS